MNYIPNESLNNYKKSISDNKTTNNEDKNSNDGNRGNTNSYYEIMTPFIL